MDAIVNMPFGGRAAFSKGPCNPADLDAQLQTDELRKLVGLPSLNMHDAPAGLLTPTPWTRSHLSDDALARQLFLTLVFRKAVGASARPCDLVCFSGSIYSLNDPMGNVDNRRPLWQAVPNDGEELYEAALDRVWPSVRDELERWFEIDDLIPIAPTSFLQQLAWHMQRGFWRFF
jgi:hypothetical protein